jgi:peptidoglycan-associated lipoprotein
MLSKRNWSVVGLGIVLALFATGCKKKVATPPAPAAPPRQQEPAPPAAPVITEFVAEPSSIERGQAATLRWSVSNANQISIDQGIGTVDASGNRRVFPNNTATYTLTANGPGGRATRSATVTVSAPAPAPPAAPVKTASIDDRLQREVQDAFFDYDKSTIRDDARSTLTADADALKRILNDFPSATVTIEGHCDERGSAEYNLGLGDRRSTAAKEFLVQLGVPAGRLKTISYGKERPQCTEGNEACWQKNRRAHFTAQ